jgi:hypothetical protein
MVYPGPAIDLQAHAQEFFKTKTGLRIFSA